MLKRCLLFLVALFISQAGHALEREIRVKRSNPSLPLVTVTIKDNNTTWRAFGSSGVDSVGLFWLDKKDAQELLAISLRAKDSYKEIIDQGRCPTSVVKSGTIGMLGRPVDNNMRFEVVCEKNNVLVHITMLDEYAINIVYLKVEWEDIYKLSNAILKYYE